MWSQRVASKVWNTEHLVAAANKSLPKDVSWIFIFTQINWDLTGTSLEDQSACVQK